MFKTKADIFKRESCFVLNIYELKPHHHLSWFSRTKTAFQVFVLKDNNAKTYICTGAFSLRLSQVDWTLYRTFERSFAVSAC